MTAEGKARIGAEGCDDGSFDTSTRRSVSRRSVEQTRRPPLRAVRAYCLWCCDGNASEVAQCPARRCPLWHLRSGHRPTASDIEQNADVTLHPSERAADGRRAVWRRRCRPEGNSAPLHRLLGRQSGRGSGVQVRHLPIASVPIRQESQHPAVARAKGGAVGEASAMRGRCQQENVHRAPLFRPGRWSAHGRLPGRPQGKTGVSCGGF